MKKTFDEQILERLDKIIRLLAINCSEKLSLKNQIKVLMEVEFTPTQISNILNKNVNLINVMKHNIKKNQEEKDEKAKRTNNKS